LGFWVKPLKRRVMRASEVILAAAFFARAFTWTGQAPRS
jgi:hypothetical protein